jgi:tripartite-type tricarboxylate transporter receptor subunit TctC
VQQKLSLAINQALGDAAVKQRLAELGAIPAGGTPGELADFQRAEQRKWAQVIKAAGILPD